MKFVRTYKPRVTLAKGSMATIVTAAAAAIGAAIAHRVNLNPDATIIVTAGIINGLITAARNWLKNHGHIKWL